MKTKRTPSLPAKPNHVGPVGLELEAILRCALTEVTNALESIPVALDSVYWKYRRKHINLGRKAAALGLTPAKRKGRKAQ